MRVGCRQRRSKTIPEDPLSGKAFFIMALVLYRNRRCYEMLQKTTRRLIRLVMPGKSSSYFWHLNGSFNRAGVRSNKMNDAICCFRPVLYCSGSYRSAEAFFRATTSARTDFTTSRPVQNESLQRNDDVIVIVTSRLGDVLPRIPS